MHFLLTALGTHGDVLPFLALGQCLTQRGHRVSLHAPEPFRLSAERAGLGFDPICSQAEYDRALIASDLWHPRRGIAPLFEMTVGVADRTARWIAAKAAEAPCLVVASPNALGARLAQDQHGVPVITVHVTPYLIESRSAAPWLPGIPVQALLPSRLRHWLGRGADRFVIDPAALPHLNALRSRADLPAVKRLRFWWNSPSRMILMFPAWYVPPQLDWPEQAVQVGFPMADQLGDAEDLAPELRAFLDAGPPPLVFTYGSGMRRSAHFFAVAVEICRRMGRRGVLLAREEGQVPANLPADIIHLRYAPLSLLLPRSAALIHHGGIGTVAQALAAGVAQMVVPVAFNHFDDGRRLARLNIGTMLRQRAFTPGRAQRAIERMLGSPGMAAARAAAAARMAADRGAEAACDEIERVAGTL
ncbi:glycosyltransferase [Methylorubrum zatmanii]|uniref:Glycosyltransferase n=1 Tax=Methylorubrum zatmanii TaxID=29429 RepID=A0ABW1WUZ6_9HYPH|nr:nucleotide disphospho-sugar-binding domain-containing protein [Methylorubrum zatmanii]MBD8906962.1 glycosyl transferase [Methylorubrum zatmanii]